MGIIIIFLSGKGGRPGRLVEGNSANVEFLNLIDGPNGQGAVVGQSQTVKAKLIQKQH